MTVTERISIRQVAQRAGVSRTTVSRALNNHPEISQGTRQRVLEVVRELEYMPVPQPMVHNRHIETGVIGLVFDGAPMESTWGMRTFWGMREAAMEHDYDLLTLLKVRPDWMMDQEELQFLDRRSDGFVFIAPQNRYQTLKTLMRHRLPVVTCYTVDAPPEVPAILLDNKDAMRQAVEHLIAHGHRRILHLTTSLERSDFQERKQGFEEAMKAASMKPLWICVDNITLEPDIKKFLSTIKQHRITAVVCACDGLAYSVWDIAASHGITVPMQLSITGMDDLPHQKRRSLTTVRYSCEEVGRRAVVTVCKLIDEGDGRKENSLVPVELVRGASVAKPAG